MQSVEELTGGGKTAEAAFTAPLDCNCSITQGGASYSISALIGNESAALFYDYGNPNASSANTGLELNNALILFLYEDINTGINSLFLIADIANSGSGGALTFEFNCVPPNAFISVEDDAGEINGSPPLITGNWIWSTCCTDGGVIEDIGCNSTMSLDLLVSSGIDSIVWLTGDIANPDHILLSLSGEAITINCGGGVCCPVGFDTGITVTDATCPDSPNGMIALSPQDGLPAYTYMWSNGATTSTNTGLLPGEYLVTITDAQGCSEELEITVGFSSDNPPAQSASIELCSENMMDFFDLTTVEDIINVGSGFSVLWFQNADMTGNIGNPSNYLSGTATVYAVVDNGSCLSDPVPVTLEILIAPVANTTSMNTCEEADEMATFDLTTLDAIVSGGNGSVSWYLDPGLTNPVSDPSEFYSGAATIYAIVSDGICNSQPVEIDLIVDPKPEGYAAEMNICGDENDEAVFDLTLLDISVSGGNGTVVWYLEIELFDPITSPSAFQTTTTTVYAVVFDGVCYSDAIPVDLIVDLMPVGNPVSAAMCDDGSGEALFNLWAYASQVSGGAGGVDWFWDPLFTDPIANPEAFLTETTIVFASIDNGLCISEPVAVELSVLESPIGNTTSLETCADSSGQGVFNLTMVDTIVSGGVDSVLWYEDAQGLFTINDPSAYMSSGSTVYAQFNDGVCLSELIPVDLIIINSVSATPVQYEVCDDGSGMAMFNLLNIANEVSSGAGQVNWFLDSTGTIVLPFPEMFLSGDTTVYASVSAGTCISDVVPIDLNVLPSPVATDMSLDICGDTIGEVTIDLTSLDTLVSGNMGNVLWFGDSVMSMAIVDPTTFITGDTIIYATVSNGSCTSPPAEILFSVSQKLSANPLVLEFCKTQGDTLVIDLTQSDIDIGGGVSQVNWFMDSLGMVDIQSPDSFPGTTSQTLYVNLTDGICTSALVPINLMILDAPIANAFSIKKCGDTNGQIIFDLTSVDPIVSGNTGIVTWYADSAQSVEIVNAGAFMSGDTTLFAIVTNGFCVSSIVPVTLDVVDSLTASPFSLQVCVMNSDTAIIDLTLSDFDISGGNGTVFWFTDNLGMGTIADPTTFTTSGDTIFAMVTADGCTSDLAMITIEVASSALPLPVCAFSSIDSLTVSWSSVAIDYELSYAINGQVIGIPWISQTTVFSLGGLGQGDTLTLWITALFGIPCTPLTNSITCITDVCSPQTIDFQGLQSAYCRDESYILINATPAGGQFSGEGISGDTLYPNLVSGNNTVVFYTWENNVTGCTYGSSMQIQIFDPPNPPVVDCQSETLNSVTFAWAAVVGEYGYEYVVNQGTESGLFQTGDSLLLIDDLNEGDEVTLSLWSIGLPPCGNSDTVSITCVTKQCPNATLSITDPGIICSDDDPFMMEVMVGGLTGIPTITWTGQGIIDPSGIFDPSLATTGGNILMVTVEYGGCSYTSSIDLHILETPLASFEVNGVPCLDSTMRVVFTGTASGAAQFNWDLSGGDVVAGSIPLDFSIQWNKPGDYALNLVIEDNGCMSKPYVISVEIDAPLDLPQLNCIEEDYYSLVISWDPVVGASEYIVSSTMGVGILAGTTYTIKNLTDDTPVAITVVAIGASACGPSSATIDCQTLDYIPPATFIPDIFSPNGDGANDVFYIQSNSQITEVNALRIFDRWGNMVFEQLHFMPNDPRHGWDGTFSGKQLNPGVYLYWSELETTSGQVMTMGGDVTLIR